MKKHVAVQSAVTFLFGTVILLDDLKQSISIDGVFDQLSPDWVWAALYCSAAIFGYWFFTHKRLRLFLVNQAILTALWMFPTVARFINVLPSSVLYAAMVFCCAAIFITTETKK